MVDMIRRVKVFLMGAKEYFCTTSPRQAALSLYTKGRAKIAAKKMVHDPARSKKAMVAIGRALDSPRMRKKPYTRIGISRVPCCRCGEPSVHQWQCCAAGNKWMTLCQKCDIGLNRVTLEYIGHPETEAWIEEYERKVGDD